MPGRDARQERMNALHGFKDQLSPLFTFLKVAVVLGVLGITGYWGFNKVMRNMQTPDIHPTDPAETTTQFFAGLYNQDYDACFELFPSDRKAAIVAGMQSRKDGYDPHFERIRNYLSTYAGENFLETMEVSEGGTTAMFAGGITLTVKMSRSKDYDKVTHYAVDEINEFPIDKDTKTGLSQHYRMLGDMMDNMDSMGGDNADDVADVIMDRPGESPGARAKRMIKAFGKARQLDSKQSILEWIVRERDRRNQSVVDKFLTELAADEEAQGPFRTLAKTVLEENEI